MAGVYPSLQEKFKSENVCPICMIEMENCSKYTCNNTHSICHRCKQFYYACPMCFTPLHLEIPHHQSLSMPQPSFNPQPYPPTAPAHEEFLEHERSYDSSELLNCPYSGNGCWAKFPKNLEALHVSRCQFRPHLEEERQPTDFYHNSDDLVACHFKEMGCQVRMPSWRKNIHEERCIYKDAERSAYIEQQLSSLNLSDPNTLVECQYRGNGCKVKMLPYRKAIHELKCNYQHQTFDDCDEHVFYTTDDENTIVECGFREHGCMVRVPIRQLMNHEARCPHNKDGVAVYISDDEYEEDFESRQNIMVECKYKDNGCVISIPIDRKDFHEERCMYRNDSCNSDGLVNCGFQYKGCKVRMPYHVKHIHEEKCNYN